MSKPTMNIYDVWRKARIGGGETPSFHNFSTSEQVIGKWIDGVDVYEKTIELDNNIGRLSTGSYYDIANIETLSIDKIIECKIIAIFDNEYYILNPYAIYIHQSHLKVGFPSVSDGSSFTVKEVILQYTKTTD